MRRPRQLRLWLSLAAAVVVVLLQQQSMFTSVTRQSTSDATAAELASTRRKLRELQQQLKQARRDVVPTSAPTTPTSSSAAAPVPIDQIALGICSCAATICARAKAMALWWPQGLDGDAYVDRLPDGAACETPAGLAVRVSAPHASWLTKPETEVVVGIEVRARDAARCSRIPSELFRSRPSKGWYVIADDDSIFAMSNLAAVLGRYPPAAPWYVGGYSESQLKTKYFGYAAPRNYCAILASLGAILF